MNKIASIQVMRGVAASLVCFSHFTGSPPYLPEGHIVREIGFHGVYGVQVFFVISGFVLPYSLYKSRYHISKFGNFLIRRVVRLDPPYLLSILLVIALGYLSMLSPLYRGKPFVVNWGDAALHLAYLNPFFQRPWLNPLYWTLAVEFQFYILLGLLFTFFVESSNIIRGLIVGAFLALSVLFKDNSFIFCHTPLFFSGIFTFLFHERKLTLPAFLSLILLMITVASFSIGPVGAMFGLATVAAILVIKGKNPAFLFLGEISYSLYLLHVPIGLRVINLTEGLTSNLAIRLVMVIVAYITSVIASFIFYKVVEEKAIAWSKKLAARRRTGPTTDP